MRAKGESGSDLGDGFIKPIKDCLEGQVTQATGHYLLLIVHVPLAQSFRAEVECIPKWLMYAIQSVPLGHKNLGTIFVLASANACSIEEPTRSNAVEHARGCVATKIGLCAMFLSRASNIASYIPSLAQRRLLGSVRGIYKLLFQVY